MTDDQLAELEALEKNTTPGPWSLIWEDDPYYREHCVAGQEQYEHILYAIASGDRRNHIVSTQHGVYQPEEHDAEFIARARTAVPELIAEVRRLQAEILDAHVLLSTAKDDFRGKPRESQLNTWLIRNQP